MGARTAIEGRRLFADALDMVDAIDKTADACSLRTLFGQQLQAFGVEHFVIADLPVSDRHLAQAVLIYDWPDGWFETYAREGFLNVDPTVRLSRITTVPFEWDEAPIGPHDAKARQVMTAARDFGLRRGFTVPVHRPNGSTASVAFGGRTPILTAATKPALRLLALYALERAKGLAQSPWQERPTNPLTAREREVLTWAAVGKSHADIAAILGITERTVTAHCVNAANKLGAANKTHAAVTAMQMKFIEV